MLLRIIIPFILVLSVFTACKSNDQSSKSIKILDSVESQISPEDVYSFRCKSLGIKNLRENIEKDYIRVWVEFSLMDSGKIVSFERFDEGWQGYLQHYRFDMNENNRTVLLSKSVTELSPVLDSTQFSNEIINLGIYDLSDTNRTKNNNICNDGGVLWVEIVRNNEYWEFIFPCYDVKETKDKASISIVKNILHKVEELFSVKIYPFDFERRNKKKENSVFGK